jgi:hypothetical protein
VSGWLFATMVDPGQWSDLQLTVHEGQVPFIGAVTTTRPHPGQSACP